MCIPTLHPLQDQGFKKGLINIHRHLSAAGTGRERSGERQRQSQQRWGRAKLASLHKRFSSTEWRESKTEKCLKLELPKPSWGSLERSPGPGALGKLHKRQRRGREGSSGTVASRARHSGSRSGCLSSPQASHRLLVTPPSPCAHRDGCTPHTAAQQELGDLLSLWGHPYGEAAVLAQWGQDTHGPSAASTPHSGVTACLPLQETHRPHVGAWRCPCTWGVLPQPRGWKTQTWAIPQWGLQPHRVSSALHTATKTTELPEERG